MTKTKTSQTLEQIQEGLASKATVIRVSACNDKDGNPRRAYVALVGPYFIGAWNEGYEGYRAVPAAFIDQARYCLTFEVTVDEYERQLAWASELQADYLQRVSAKD